jgi:hypothetical protein
MGKTPPQGTMNEKIRTTVARQLCPSRQDNFVENGILLSEGLGEDVFHIFY